MRLIFTPEAMILYRILYFVTFHYFLFKLKHFFMSDDFYENLFQANANLMMLLLQEKENIQNVFYRRIKEQEREWRK